MFTFFAFPFLFDGRDLFVIFEGRVFELVFVLHFCPMILPEFWGLQRPITNTPENAHWTCTT